jgi:hypothetical protein
VKTKTFREASAAYLDAHKAGWSAIEARQFHASLQNYTSALATCR